MSPSRTIEDSGIGLTAEEVHTLLATIGRSSKRGGEHGLESARQEFLGQVGIGLLACFVVARQIRMVTCSARTPDAAPVEWLASDDGPYTVRALPDEARPEPGTTVYLEPRPGAEERTEAARVEELARDFGSLLPYDITFAGADGAERPVTDRPAVWDRPYPTPATCRGALSGHCARLFGFAPSTRSTSICRSPGCAEWRMCCRSRPAPPTAPGAQMTRAPVM